MEFRRTAFYTFKDFWFTDEFEIKLGKEPGTGDSGYYNQTGSE